MKKGIIIAAVLVAVAAVIVFAMTRPEAEPAPSTTSDANQAEGQTTPQNNAQTGDQIIDNGDETTPQSVTIVYSGSGFEPSRYAVASGDTVTIRNGSGRILDFASDDHPAHTDNSELNVGAIQPGQSRQFTPTRTGTWGFHNHEFDAHSGVLVVQ